VDAAQGQAGAELLVALADKGESSISRRMVVSSSSSVIAPTGPGRRR
jgi:hypothetical protein